MPTKNNKLKELLPLYKKMLLIRRFEEKAGQLYGMGEIGGFCHLYIGQEAVVVGVQSVQESQDTVITSYRDHGHMLACGMDPKGVMAELTGRIDGYSKGKGGSMHMFSKEKNFFGGNGIVAAQVPIGTGLGLAHQYKGTGGVSVVYFGDGAVNQGQVYESFNMAALWKLPVVFILENNRYAMGTSINRGCANPDELFKRGQAYGIPGHKVDGMNVEEVRSYARDALARARGGDGPVLLEMMTYRYRGHSMSDPATYRSKDEVEEVKLHHDPIKTLGAHLMELGVSESELQQIDKDIKAQMKEVAQFALSSPEPEAQELYKDVYI